MAWNDKDKRDLTMIIIGALIGFILLVSALVLYDVVLGNDELPALNPYANDANQGGDQLKQDDQDNSTAGADLLNFKNATTSSLGNESPHPEPPKIVLR